MVLLVWQRAHQGASRPAIEQGLCHGRRAERQ
jgi:hypothetical protein